jgi:hypothetical protein
MSRAGGRNHHPKRRSENKAEKKKVKVAVAGLLGNDQSVGR